MWQRQRAVSNRTAIQRDTRRIRRIRRIILGQYHDSLGGQRLVILQKTTATGRLGHTVPNRTVASVYRVPICQATSRLLLRGYGKLNDVEIAAFSGFSKEA